MAETLQLTCLTAVRSALSLLFRRWSVVMPRLGHPSTVSSPLHSSAEHTLGVSPRPSSPVAKVCKDYWLTVAHYQYIWLLHSYASGW